MTNQLIGLPVRSLYMPACEGQKSRRHLLSTAIMLDIFIQDNCWMNTYVVNGAHAYWWAGVNDIARYPSWRDLISCWSQFCNTRIEIENSLHVLEASAPSVSVVLPAMISVNVEKKKITRMCSVYRCISCGFFLSKESWFDLHLLWNVEPELILAELSIQWNYDYVETVITRVPEQLVHMVSVWKDLSW